MTDVPSNRTHMLVKVLGAMSTNFATDPKARRIFKAMDARRDFDALARLFAAGVDSVGDLDDGVVMASDAHYKRLAREIVEYSQTYPEDAPRDLAGFLKLMELVPFARTNEFKKRAGLH